MKHNYLMYYTLWLSACLLALWISIYPASVHALDIQAVSCDEFINEAPARVSCGYVNLPLDHANPQGRSIKLPMLIAQSTKSLMARSEYAILVPGAGGPGAAMGFGYQYAPGEYLAHYNTLRQAGFDVVLVDQRGAGLSTPLLNCVETINAFKTLIVRARSVDDEIDYYQNATTKCRARLNATGLTNFDTTQSAKDFLHIMANLPYERWGVIATSYATVIAQAMLLQNPQAFDRVVLDSPVPLDYQRPLTTETTYESVVKTITRCEQTSRCHSRYPKLLSRFNKIISRAARKPYKLTFKVADDHYQRVKHRIVIDEHTLVAIFANAIYDNESIARLPSVIKSMHQGRLGMLRAFAEDYWYQSTDNTFADALNLTIHCKERQSLEELYQKNNPGFVSSLSADSLKILSAQQKICDIWSTPPDTSLIAETGFKAQTLIIAGSLDPVISPEDIANTTNDFSNPDQAIVAGAGHAVWFQSQCTRDAVVNFFGGHQPTGMKTCQSQVPLFK